MSGGTLTGSLLVAVAAGLAVHGLLTAHDHRRIAFAARSQVGLTSADEGSAQRPQIDRRLLIATVAAAAIGLLVGGPLGIIVAPFPYAANRSLAARRQRRRQESLDEALGASLQLMIDQLRVGRDLTGAFTTVAESALFPLNEILDSVLAEARLGRPLHDAVEAAAEAEQNRHFDVIASAIGLHGHHGGSLTEILSTVSESIEAEDELRREVETLTAEGRLSAQVLMALPLASLALLSLLSPGYAGPLFTTSAGHALTIVGLVLGAAGWGWLRALSRPGMPL
jgi:tight adherence protein B